MSTLEKYFLSQLHSHHCQLPPSDDFEYMQKVGRFKNFFLISEKSLQSYLRVRSISGIYYEKRRQVRTALKFIIHPYSRLCNLYHVAHFFLLLAAFLYFPFFCAFHGPLYAKFLLANGKDLTTFYVLLGIMLLLQFFFLLHIIVTFAIGYSVDGKEEIVIHFTGIAKQYFCTYFLLDLVSTLPLDALLLAARGIEEYSKLSRVEMIFLNIVTLLKFSRLGTLNHCFRVTYGKVYSSFAAYNMVAIVGLYFLIIHWGCCSLVLFSRWVYFESLFTIFDNVQDLLHLYVNFLYISLTTFVNTGWEINEFTKVSIKALLFVLLIIGKVFRIVILIVFLQFLSTLMAGKLHYMEIMDQVAQYMRIKNFPQKLRRKVKTNYVYLFRKEYIGEQSILRLLSDNLRREILLRIHHNLIEKVDLFSGLSQDLLFDFLSCLKQEIYLPNDVIFQTGDSPDYMYFVSFGTLSVFTGSREICHLHDGDYFGEISIIFKLRRIATIVALETTELYSLDAQDLLELINTHPAIYPRIEKIARSRLEIAQDSNFDQMADNQHKSRFGWVKREGQKRESESDIKSDSD